MMLILAACYANLQQDGDLDILHGVYAGSGVKLFRNTGNGMFEEVSPSTSGISQTDPGTTAAWGDYNGDGLLARLKVLQTQKSTTHCTAFCRRYRYSCIHIDAKANFCQSLTGRVHRDREKWVEDSALLRKHGRRGVH